MAALVLGGRTAAPAIGRAGDPPRVEAVQARPLERHEFTRLLMGVEVRIMVWSDEQGRAREAATSALERIAAIEDVASDWRASSEVSRLCAAPVGVDVAVSDDLLVMLVCARRVSLASAGAFDVTIGAVTHLWRRARAAGFDPTPQERAEALARVGFRHLVLDAEQRTVRLAAQGVEIDLGGIAQGYAAREALKVMDEAGLGACVIDVSGDIALGDPPPGAQGWRVAVPDAGGWRTLVLSRCAVSTSGDSEQFVLVDGRRESHVLAPATGRGVVGMRSVTVIAGDAMLADALATAISVVGVERGLALGERVPGVEALVVQEDEGGLLRDRATGGFPPGAPPAGATAATEHPPPA